MGLFWKEKLCLITKKYSNIISNLQVGNQHSENVSRGHNQGMRLPQTSSPRMAKSTSLGVMIDRDHEDMHIVDQDDIIGLTQDVKNFSDGLANLKAVFNDEGGENFFVVSFYIYAVSVVIL